MPSDALREEFERYWLDDCRWHERFGHRLSNGSYADWGTDCAWGAFQYAHDLGRLAGLEEAAAKVDRVEASGAKRYDKKQTLARVARKIRALKDTDQP